MKKYIVNFILCVCMMLALPVSAQKSDAWMKKVREVVEKSPAFAAVKAKKVGVTTISDKLMKEIVFDDIHTHIDTLTGYFDLWVEGDTSFERAYYNNDTTVVVMMTDLAIVWGLEKGDDYKVNLYVINNDNIVDWFTPSTKAEKKNVLASADTTNITSGSTATASMPGQKLDTVDTRLIADGLLSTKDRSTGEEFFFRQNKETMQWESFDPKAQVIKVGDRKKDPSFLLYEGELLGGNKRNSPMWGMGNYAGNNRGIVYRQAYGAVYQPAFQQPFYSQPFYGGGYGGYGSGYGNCGWGGGFGLSFGLSFGYSSWGNSGWCQNPCGGGFNGPSYVIGGGTVWDPYAGRHVPINWLSSGRAYAYNNNYNSGYSDGYYDDGSGMVAEPTQQMRGERSSDEGGQVNNKSLPSARERALAAKADVVKTTTQPSARERAAAAQAQAEKVTKPQVGVKKPIQLSARERAQLAAKAEVKVETTRTSKPTPVVPSGNTLASRQSAQPVRSGQPSFNGGTRPEKPTQTRKPSVPAQPRTYVPNKQPVRSGQPSFNGGTRPEKQPQVHQQPQMRQQLTAAPVTRPMRSATPSRISAKRR